jgi:hypothetical protein
MVSYKYIQLLLVNKKRKTKKDYQFVTMESEERTLILDSAPGSFRALFLQANHSGTLGNQERQLQGR